MCMRFACPHNRARNIFVMLPIKGQNVITKLDVFNRFFTFWRADHAASKKAGNGYGISVKGIIILGITIGKGHFGQHISVLVHNFTAITTPAQACGLTIGKNNLITRGQVVDCERSAGRIIVHN